MDFSTLNARVAEGEYTIKVKDYSGTHLVDYQRTGSGWESFRMGVYTALQDQYHLSPGEAFTILEQAWYLAGFGPARVLDRALYLVGSNHFGGPQV